MTDQDRIAVATRLAAALITSGQARRGDGSGTIEQWAAKIFQNVYKAIPVDPGIPGPEPEPLPKAERTRGIGWR